jgi:hypothetical protein
MLERRAIIARRLMQFARTAIHSRFVYLLSQCASKGKKN